MSSEIFYWVLNMSITASIMGLIIYFLSKIHKVPRNIICILWAIPFIRMCIPVSISSNFSLMSLISKFATKTVTVYDGIVNFTATNSIQLADSYFPVTYKINLLEPIFSVAMVVWLIVAISLITAMIILYVSTKRELKNVIHLQDNVYISDKITSPATYGIIKPKIILPKSYNKNDFKYILLHENAHIKRLDNLWRIIAIATTCVHWFNPLSWIFLKSFIENLELACDEGVLKLCTEKEKKAYALTLLNCAQSKTLYASAFGGARIKTRIERILSYKRLSAIACIAFAVLSIAIGYILLTNAK